MRIPRSPAITLSLLLALAAGCGGDDDSAPDLGGLDATVDTGVADAAPLSDGGSDAEALIDAGSPVDGAAPACSSASPGDGFARIPAGTFMMGSPLSEPFREAEEGLHEVTLSHDFWLGTTEVTQAQWRALMASSPSGFTACGDTCPVEQISWLDAVAYANARSRDEGLPECYLADGNVVGGASIYECCGYRLPTEAEWEYAARAGTATATYAGDLLGGADDCLSEGTVVNGIAWWCGNAGDRTHPVGEKAPNAFGVRDMIGNVWEWTHDWYGFNAGPITDPAVSTDVEGFGSRLIRGGSWINQARLLRAAYRARALPTDADMFTGLRLARTAL